MSLFSCRVFNVCIYGALFTFFINSGSADAKKRLLLISMDGFRADYVQKYDTPNFERMASKGTRAPYLTGTFVSQTFPSHYTIATGLHTESHGIVANSMYDPEFNAIFTKRNKESRWWDGGEPLWVTARKNGLRSASYFWPGDDVEIRGYRPVFYYGYDPSVTFKDRVDAAISWLNDTTNDIDLAMVYINEPDQSGHLYGPDGVSTAVKDVDDVLGYLMDIFTANDMWKDVNVIVTSDHGMAEIDTPRRFIDLSKILDMNAIEQIPRTGAATNILPKDGMEDEIIANLTNVDHITVYRKQDIPERLHYQNNRRILPILIVADEGWMVGKDAQDYDVGERGAHGYDNELESMRPIFYARGPDIRVGHVVPPFRSVDIYPLVCKLLGMEPAPNNGSLSNTKDVLVDGTSGFSRLIASMFVVMSACVVYLGIS